MLTHKSDLPMVNKLGVMKSQLASTCDPRGKSTSMRSIVSRKSLIIILFSLLNYLLAITWDPPWVMAMLCAVSFGIRSNAPPAQHNPKYYSQEHDTAHRGKSLLFCSAGPTNSLSTWHQPPSPSQIPCKHHNKQLIRKVHANDACPDVQGNRTTNCSRS